MNIDDQREKVIQNVAEMLWHNPFSVEFKVLKHPKGIKVIYEVTEEQMNSMVDEGMEKHKKEKAKAEWEKNKRLG